MTPAQTPITACLLHNPRCSKSRATLALLQEHGIAVEVIDYLAAPPTIGVLVDLLDKLGLHARDIVRFGESRATELGLSAHDERSECEWLSLLAANPILIERPIVVLGQRAVLGRPPENVLTLLLAVD